MGTSQNDDIIKKILNEFDTGKTNGNLNINDIRKKLKTLDKTSVAKKLNSMGLDNVAQMILKMSDDDIINGISKNPGILKKINKLLQAEV